MFGCFLLPEQYGIKETLALQITSKATQKENLELNIHPAVCGGSELITANRFYCHKTIIMVFFFPEPYLKAALLDTGSVETLSTETNFSASDTHAARTASISCVGR